MSDHPKLARLEGSASAMGLLDFADVNKLTGMEAKREQMLARCQEIYDGAASRKVTSKVKGRGVVATPDYAAMCKALELSCKLMGLIADAERKVKEPVETERRAADIEQVASLLRGAGWKVEAPPKAA